MPRTIALVAAVVVAAVAAVAPAAPVRAQGSAVDTSQLQGTTPEGARLDVAVAAARKRQGLDLTVGESQPIALSAAISDVIVANPDVADVVVKGPTSVYLLGRAPGSTSVFFVGPDGDVVKAIEAFVSADLEGAVRALRQVLPAARIDLRAVGASVVMSGWVRAAADVATAQAVLEGFLAGGGQGDSQGPKVINSLKIAGDQQVLLQVRVAEVQRTTLKTLGVNTNLDFGDDSGFLPNLLGEQIGNQALGRLNIGKWAIDEIFFSTLETQGLVKVLAEPTLTAISGETANFLAGGEFPVPAGLDDQGNVRIEFRPFGVVLSFTPVVLANEQLSLRIATEVSRTSEENGLPFELAGGVVTIPGLSVRRAQSTVMLPSGGSLMIAGLLQNDEFNTVDGVPGLKDLPVIGPLFRSTEFRNNRSELVVTVRAFTVRPVEFAGDLALPTDGFVPASDIDLYVMGRLHATYGSGEPGESAIAGPIGYIME